MKERGLWSILWTLRSGGNSVHTLQLERFTEARKESCGNGNKIEKHWIIHRVSKSHKQSKDDATGSLDYSSKCLIGIRVSKHANMKKEDRQWLVHGNNLREFCKLTRYSLSRNSAYLIFSQWNGVIVSDSWLVQRLCTVYDPELNFPWKCIMSRTQIFCRANVVSLSFI